MKKPSIFIIVLSILLVILIKYNLSTGMYAEPAAAAENYLTSGIFNQHRLLIVKKCSLMFSDGTEAVVEAKGMAAKPPHRTLTFKLFLTKNKKGIWTVRKLYPQ